MNRPGSLTGNLDSDRTILLTLGDADLLKICVVNNYMRNTVCNENFWKIRTYQLAPGLVKPAGMTWRQFYLSLIAPPPGPAPGGPVF